LTLITSYHRRESEVNGVAWACVSSCAWRADPQDLVIRTIGLEEVPDALVAMDAGTVP
jgi:hypothetical protein